MADLTPPVIPPNLGAATPSTIEDLQVRLTKAEQTIVQLTSQLTQLNTNFAQHVHQFGVANAMSGQQRFGNFIQFPDQNNEMLVPFRDPADTRPAPTESTGTFIIPPTG